MEESEKSTYLLLDFNGKLTTDIFKEKVFIKVINLEKKNPLVQINDLTFKGTYEPALGTNLYFDEVPDDQMSPNLFEQQTPINLKHVLSQDKILKLKQVKLSQNKIEEPDQSQAIKLNLKWNYNTLKEKFENGTLDLELLDSKSDPNASTSSNADFLELTESNQNKAGPCETPQENELKAIPVVNIVEHKYKKLKELARRPVKRLTEEEEVEDCSQKYKNAYEMHNLKCRIISPANAFFINPIPIQEETLSNAVDIDRCVLYGIIEPSDEHPRKLTSQEKNVLLTLDNFDNLSLPARYYVMKMQLKNLEEYIQNAPQSELNKYDNFGRTPLVTLSIYKDLVNYLKQHIPSDPVC